MNLCHGVVLLALILGHVSAAFYKIVVHTSDFWFAGTDANVILQLLGNHGNTADAVLDGPGDNHEQGSVETFYPFYTYVGYVCQLKIRASNDGIFDDWHLNKIEVTDTQTTIHSVFHFQREIEGSWHYSSKRVVNGGWGNWGSWSACSVTCHTGQQLRARTCDHPTPKCGGQTCVGPGQETKHCVITTQTDGGWGGWGAWGTCDVACGTGEHFRSRLCNNPYPICNGRSCDGASLEKQPCLGNAVNGGWSNWGAWSSCSVSCGEGERSHDRSCDDPVPSCGGNPCLGVSSTTEPCNELVCPTPSVESTATTTQTSSSTTAPPNNPTVPPASSVESTATTSSSTTAPPNNPTVPSRLSSSLSSPTSKATTIPLALGNIQGQTTDDDEESTGIYAGVGVAILVVLIAIVLLFIAYRRRRPKRKSDLPLSFHNSAYIDPATVENDANDRTAYLNPIDTPSDEDQHKHLQHSVSVVSLPLPPVPGSKLDEMIEKEENIYADIDDIDIEDGAVGGNIYNEIPAQHCDPEVNEVETDSEDDDTCLGTKDCSKRTSVKEECASETSGDSEVIGNIYVALPHIVNNGVVKPDGSTEEHISNA